jgi:hypothetical protein
MVQEIVWICFDEKRGTLPVAEKTHCLSENSVV